MEKDALTLPTWNILKTTGMLFQFKKSTLQLVSTSGAWSIFKTYKGDSLNAFQKSEIPGYWFIPSDKTGADKRSQCATKSLFIDFGTSLNHRWHILVNKIQPKVALSVPA